MGLQENLQGIAAGLAVIVLGLALFLRILRRGSDPERLGFEAYTEAPQEAKAIAQRLFGAPSQSVYRRGAQHRVTHLMRIAAGNSDTPDCIVGFVDIRTTLGGGDVALLHSERRIPSILARLERGVLEWARPVDPGSDRLRPGTGWYWYTDGNCTLEDARVTRAFAQTSHQPGAKKLLGIALLGTQVAVWGDISETNCVAEWLDRLTFDLAPLQ